jgi:hypothetical protein
MCAALLFCFLVVHTTMLDQLQSLLIFGSDIRMGFRKIAINSLSVKMVGILQKKKRTMKHNKEHKSMTW